MCLTLETDKMIYSEKYTTTWHDTDAFRRVRPSQLLVYMQEVSNHHMSSCGMSLDELRDKRGLAFILSRIRMEIYAPLYAFEEIEVQTWTCESHGYAIRRFYRIMRGDRTIAVVDSIWALVNINSGELVRWEDCGEYDFEDGEPVELGVPARLRIPRGVELYRAGSRRIVYSDLDYNMHMNNTRYPDMLCDYLPLEDTGRIRGFVLSYLCEAAYGDVIDVCAAREGDSVYFRTLNASGKTCLEAQVLFNGEK